MSSSLSLRTLGTPRGIPRRLRCDHTTKGGSMGIVTDAEADVAPGETRGRHVRSRCRCSMCPAIHIK